MKKYSFISVSALGTAASLLLGASVALAAPYTVTGSAQTNSTVNTNTTGGINVNIGVGATAGTSTSVTSGAMASTTSNTNSNNDSGTNYTSANASISIGSNDSQLTSYAHSIAASDSSISAVSADDNNVSISYRVPVRLFGFIPVSEIETASVDTSASDTPKVKVHHSWWSFLATGNNRANEEDAFSTALNAKMNASASTASQFDIMAGIEAAARSSMSGSASVNTNTSASAY